ncbi:enolase C-terminal domain-like protein [Nocardiopsis nanhaiensis]
MLLERIEFITVTPIAFPDPPLLSAAGAHEPLALRAVVQVHTTSGYVGLGECHGSAALLRDIETVAGELVGIKISDIAVARQRAAILLAHTRADRAFSPLEVGMLDAFGQCLGVRVVDLLGGEVRDQVEFCGYLFYKWSSHLDVDHEDCWGAVASSEDVVALARVMYDRYGFRSWKLKGGVHTIGEELEAVRALRVAFPESSIRIDPNCRWTLDSSYEVAEQLSGIVDYLEDPCNGLANMARLKESSPVPLATNMLAEDFAKHMEVLQTGAADIVLLDHHVVGGLQRAVVLSQICQAWGLRTAMHSNSHLGISLAAMTHLAATVSSEVYSNDTHYPWNEKHDILQGGPLQINEGILRVPEGPGLGVQLDEDLLGEAHERYLASNIRERRDSDYARRHTPLFKAHHGTWTMRDSGWPSR